jgi:hypothetical protein
MTPSLDPLVNGRSAALIIFVSFCVKHGRSTATFDTHQGARQRQLEKWYTGDSLDRRVW